MTDLRIVRTDKYPDPMQHPDILFKIPKVKRDAIAGYKNEKARRQSASAWLLLSDMLLERGMDLALMDVNIGAQGKPMIEGINFSLSHSGDYVLCALSDTPVGVDIQKAEARTASHVERLVDRFFTEDEKLAMEKLGRGTAEYEKMFFAIFSCKEAFIKCTGEGLSRDLRSFTVPLIRGENETDIDGVTYRFEVKEYGRYRNCRTTNDGFAGSEGAERKEKEVERFEEAGERLQEISGGEASEEDNLHDSHMEDYYCSACCSAVLSDHVLCYGQDVE